MSAGTVGIGDAADVAGTDLLGLGFPFHVDVLASSWLIVLPIASDASGDAVTPIAALPADPSFVGLTIYGQSVWLWSSCALPPFQFSSSEGVSFTLLAP